MLHSRLTTRGVPEAPLRSARQLTLTPKIRTLWTYLSRFAGEGYHRSPLTAHRSPRRAARHSHTAHRTRCSSAPGDRSLDQRLSKHEDDVPRAESLSDRARDRTTDSSRRAKRRTLQAAHQSRQAKSHTRRHGSDGRGLRGAAPNRCAVPARLRASEDGESGDCHPTAP